MFRWAKLLDQTVRCSFLARCILLDWLVKQYIVKTAFVFEKKNQNEDQRAVFWRKASLFEALIRGEIAQALGIACTTTWNVLKKKENTGILSNRHLTGQPKKTAVDDRNIVRAVMKTSKTSVRDIKNNLHSPQDRGEGISINYLKKT